MQRQDGRRVIDRVHCVFEEPKVIGEKDWAVVELSIEGLDCDMFGDGSGELGNGYRGKVGDEGESYVLWTGS
jgi:hypothetical protein